MKIDGSALDVVHVLLTNRIFIPLKTHITGAGQSLLCRHTAITKMTLKVSVLIMSLDGLEINRCIFVLGYL